MHLELLRCQQLAPFLQRCMRKGFPGLWSILRILGNGSKAIKAIEEIIKTIYELRGIFFFNFFIVRDICLNRYCLIILIDL